LDSSLVINKKNMRMCKPDVRARFAHMKLASSVSLPCSLHIWNNS